MELVAYGAQDIYLTGNPQITFFKVVYRRHTNFSMESIEQTWLGTELTTDSGMAGKCEAIISRNGDLISRMYLELNVTNSGNVSSLVDGFGNYRYNVTTALLENIELQIGGQRIDKQSGAWMEAWAELTEPNIDGTTHVYSDEAGGTLFQKMSGFGGCNDNGTNIFTTDLNPKFFVPLFFWFCRNPGLSLPLIALQYHEVKVILNHRYNSNHHQFDSNKLWCDYIYLDTDERRRFAQVSHEYLIEQVQEKFFAEGPKIITNENLNFNHPVKEFVFVNYSGAILTEEGKLSDIAASGNPTLKLVLNGSDRFKERDYRYFTRTQVNQHHTGNGIGINSATTSSTGKIIDSIGVYSFALKPEEHQPSGTCNFSRIDSAILIATATLNLTHIFAVNYNVLRIMSGMGGLAYSN